MPTSPNNIQQYPTFLTKVKLCPTSSNNTQHHPTMPNMGGQTIPIFIPNIVGICWAKMLASFGQGLTHMPMAQDKCSLKQALPYVRKYMGLPLWSPERNQSFHDSHFFKSKILHFVEIKQSCIFEEISYTLHAR